MKPVIIAEMILISSGTAGVILDRVCGVTHPEIYWGLGAIGVMIAVDVAIRCCRKQIGNDYSRKV